MTYKEFIEVLEKLNDVGGEEILAILEENPGREKTLFDYSTSQNVLDLLNLFSTEYSKENTVRSVLADITVGEFDYSYDFYLIDFETLKVENYYIPYWFSGFEKFLDLPCYKVIIDGPGIIRIIVNKDDIK